MKKITKIIFAALGLLVVTNSFAQPTYEWAGKFGGTANEYGYDITTDVSGNVYTIGYFAGTADFDPGVGITNLISAGGNDVFITKMSPSGNLIWAKRMGGTGDDIGYAIDLDATGNVYSTGYFAVTADFDPGAGIFNLATNVGGADVFISKLDNNGNFIFAKQFTSTALSGSGAEDLNIDGSGNIYISGGILGTVDCDPGPGILNLVSPSASFDIMVAKLDANGNLLWAKRLGGVNYDYSHGSIVDAAGNCYLSGYYQGTIDSDPGAGVVNITSVGSIDAFIVKLDAAGNFVWSKSIGGLSIDRIFDVQLDGSGNVLATGYFQGTADFDPGAGIANMTALAGYDGFVLKLDQSGNFAWSKQIAGSSTDYPAAMALDQSGSVYLTGFFQGTSDFDPGAGISTISAIGFDDAFITKLDMNGNFVWVIPIAGTLDEAGLGISVDNSDNIYTTGYFENTIDFDPGIGVANLTSVGSGNYDVFVSKLSQCNNDITDPVVNVGSLPNITSQCSVTSLTAPTATDNCAGTITGTHNVTVPITTQGTTVVTWTYNDGNGNTTTQNQNIIINDNTNPVANIVTLPNVTSQCSVTSLTAPTATDNCAGTITGTHNVTLPITTQGTTVVTWTYNDGNGNTTTQNQNIIINDNTNPVANIVTLPDVTGQCSVTSLTAPTATDNCTGTITGTHNVTLPITTQGTTVVTWTYNDGNGNTTTQNQNIIINDNTNPVANIVTLPNVTSQCSVTSLTAPTATDNCAGTITGTHNVTLPITTQGTTVVTWTYNDGNGNTITQNQNIIIADNTNPVANIVTLPNVTSQCSVTSLTAPTATDNCAGTITGTHNVTLPITTQGTTVVTWTYDDGNGNITTQNQNVIIDDITNPVADVVSLADITSQCSVTSLTAPTATDNCAGTLTGTHNVTLPITTQGTTVVTWTYDDGNGNITTQNQNVIIDDITNPVADIISLADMTSQCSVTSLTAPTATDNCAGTLTGTHNVTLPITTQGTTVVTWTYDDGNGNTITQNQNVIIDDITNPVADIISLADITSQCSVTSLTAPTATDNCVGSITATHATPLPITTQGTTVVTWTYDDGNGNITTQNQNVIINQIDNSVALNITTITATASGYTYQWIDCGNGNTPIAGETNQSFTAITNGSYAVEISNGSCSVTSDCIDIVTVSINENDNQNGIIVFPNPNNGIFDVAIQLAQNKTIEIELLDMSGKIIESSIFSGDSKIHLVYPNLEDGLYLLRIKKDNNNTIHKIIIQQ